MTPTIAFVGAGPTTVYTLARLLADGPADVEITLFEQQRIAGQGSPYRPGWNDPAMLANIASIEIPPVTQTLLDWLSAKSPAERASMGVRPHEINARAFLPRIVLGRYFADELETLIAKARADGVIIDLRTGCRVIDACCVGEEIRLTVAPHLGFVTDECFDHVVLATGHQWPTDPEVSPGYFSTPWPASKLANLPPAQVGIRGSSLTAIDAAVALALSHGVFIEDGDDLTYRPNPDTEAFGLTMMSRKGLLPEADFYFPVPMAPPTLCTSDAIARLQAGPDKDLLDQAFDLFKQELTLCDPVYARDIGLEAADLETFCDAYFAERARVDPFVWAQANLDEARRNLQAEFAVPWRYAILRMHDVIAQITPRLNQRQFERFNRWLKPVFVDNYGAVPPASIARMLALHRAGKLEVTAVGDDYRLEIQPACSGAVVTIGDVSRPFAIFIEATGQRPLAAGDFPFPSLRAQGVIRDAGAADGQGTTRGIAIDDDFHPLADDAGADRLFCLGLPFIMGRHPFIQGITSSHDMGSVVGAALAQIGGRATALETPERHAA
jgi:uncharacterized NAD(P)/FAD-binding protein YdhS